jgi:hypothetical protein
MASINDVFNQLQAVNTTLGQIHADGIAQTNATNTVNASVNTLDGDVKAGFAATVQALQTIAQINVESVKLIFHLTKQADAMICSLEQISKNTCGILTQATVQTRLQTAIADDADAVREIAESAHPEAALERQRRAALRAQVERCCPPRDLGPACTYQPCPHPERAPEPKLPRVEEQQSPPR